jgi:hypothetical protein
MCRPGVPCRRLGSYHQPADWRWARRQQHRSPGRPRPGLEAVAAALHGQAGPARYSIYLSQRTAPDRTAHYICSRGLCPVRLPHGSRRRGAPLIDYGAVMTGSTGTTRRLYSARRRTSPRRRSPQGASGRAWYPGSARSGHLRRPGDFHHRDLYGRRFVLLACRDQWRGVDLGCRARNAAAWRTARCMYIASAWSWEVLKWRRPPRIASKQTARCWSAPVASSPGAPRLPRTTPNAR